ncbi:MAG: hypothetical protein Q9162_004533 [Coniocarpon cinnabarinum]
MRLRLTIKRHELPLVKVLQGIPNASTATVSELISQVNGVIPLESEDGEWGLEDYIVSVDSFECVHYANVSEVLKEDDEVEIRAAQSVDARARRLSGRLQISREGARLLDGLPYGSRRMRKTARPSFNIPPLKKRRLLADENEDVSDDEALFEDRPMDDDPGTGDDGAGAMSSEDSSSEEESDEEESIADDEIAALRNDQAAPTQGFNPSPSRKRKRVQFQEHDKANPDDIESSENGSDGSFGLPESAKANHMLSSASSSDVSSVTSEESSGNAEDEDSGELDNAAEEEFGDSSSSSSESSDSSDSLSVSSDSASELDDNEHTDDPTTLTTPSSSSPKHVNDTTKTQKNASTAGDIPALIERRHDELKRRVKGLVHPSMANDAYLQGLLNSKALEVAQPLTTVSPPGMGKYQTHKRNRRRKEARLRKFQLQQQGQETAKEPEERMEDPDEAITAVETLHHFVPYQNVASESLAHESMAAKPVHGKAASHEAGELSDAGSGHKKWIDKLSPNAAHSSALTGEGPKAQSQGDARAGAEQADHDAKVTAPPEISTSSLSQGVLDAATKAVTTATTGPRLRIGVAAKRTIKSALGSALPRKRPAEHEDDVGVQPPPKQRNWQDVINLQVVECGATDVDLPVPPFPFKQRWHNIPGRVFGKQRQEYLKAIKDKYGVSDNVDEGEKAEDGFISFSHTNADGVESHEKAEKATKSRVGPRDSLLQSTSNGAGLNYDDEDPSGDSHTLQAPSKSPSSSVEDVAKDAEDGYPLEPIDIERLTPLTVEQCESGAFIYFKKLEISPGGFPQMAGFRTARIQNVNGPVLELKLARRDVSQRDEEAEELHRKFHVQTEEDETDQDDGRDLTAEFSELVEPSLIQL